MASHSGALRASVMEAPCFVDEDAKAPNGPDQKSYSLFFYGTLVHPAILIRMIGGSGEGITSQPAILEEYALHHVVGEEYPALISAQQSKALIAHAANKGGKPGEAMTVFTQPRTMAVRGTIVKGLSADDVAKLDAFEGDEYVRVAVMAMPDQRVPPFLIDSQSGGQAVDDTLASLSPERIQAMLLQRLPLQPCHVYRWRAPIQKLESNIWTFETFMKSGNHTKWWQA